MEKFKFYNPAFGGQGEVNAEYDIPSEGEYFIIGDKEVPVIGIRKGNKVISIDYNAYAKANGITASTEGQLAGAVAHDIANKAGIDYDSLQAYNHNQGMKIALDMKTTYGTQVGTVEELKSYESKPDSTEPVVDMKAKAEAEAPANAAAAASAAAQGGDVFAEQEAAKAAGGEGTVKAAGFQGEQGGDIRGEYLGPQAFQNLVNNLRGAGISDSEIEEHFINRIPNTLTGVTDIFLKQGVTQDQTFVDSVIAKRKDGADVSIGGDTDSQITEDLTEQKQQEQVAGNIDNLLVNSGLPQDQQDLIKAVVDAYPENTDISDESILEAFENLSKTIIDPYFQGLIKQTEADITLAINRSREDRELEQQLELEQAQQRFEQSQSQLEASGMTRSGLASKKLGSQSGARGATGIGEVPLLSQRIAESSGKAFQRGLENIGSAAEKTLGTAGLAGVGLPEYSPTNDIIGSIPQAKTTAQANLLGQLSNQQGSLEDFQRQFI